ncbi:MAG: amidase [Gammaproteobacteria bacterium]|nr:amidase [Gammaproteobacteria bacterium]
MQASPHAARIVPVACRRPRGRNSDRLSGGGPRQGRAVIIVKTPSLDEIERIALQFGLDLSHEDLVSFRGLMAGPLASYGRLQELIEPRLPVKYPRSPGYRPDRPEDPLNAWYYKTAIEGAPRGPLRGRTVAIKDNICVAGVPMMNGTSVLESYVPDVDATVVTRILDAGGEIAGKADCESLCFSGASHTTDNGPTLNPYDHARSAGGSSAGSAALVAAGEVDMAIGGDQGGSIRIPAGWCGVYGLKPTHGLVPYTGAFPIEATLDHLGPLARTTADVATLLEVIAGEDGMDPRQTRVKAEAYSKALTGHVEGMRIGIVSEGFAWPGLSQADVDDMVMRAAGRFEQLGAVVSTMSLPMHRDGIHIWNAISIEGATALMLKGNSMGTNWKGYYTTGLLDAFARGWRSRPDDLSDTTKLVLLLGEYMQSRYHGRFYAKAQNLALKLKAAYDAAFQQVDLLVMPTLPMKATKIPAGDAPRAECIARALEMLPNTAPFNVTGHPAMNVPCGLSQGLPVGMMLIGKSGAESTLLRASHAFEHAVDWKKA